MTKPQPVEERIAHDVRAAMISLRLIVLGIERVADALESMQHNQSEALAKALLDELGSGGDRSAGVEPEHTTDG
jgi:hypothetical protein